MTLNASKKTHRRRFNRSIKINPIYNQSSKIMPHKTSVQFFKKNYKMIAPIEFKQKSRPKRLGTFYYPV